MRSIVLTLAGLLLAPVVAVAQAPPPQLSAMSIGDAKFGSTAVEVERALGRKLKLFGDARKAGVAKFTCGDAGIEGIPNVELHFEKGRMIAASLSGPPLTTRGGFAVGDPEGKVIAKFRSDRSYRREPNHYAEPGDKNAAMEITLGSHSLDRGYAVKFMSRRGVVKLIEAGQSSYVLLFEREGTCS